FRNQISDSSSLFSDAFDRDGLHHCVFQRLVLPIARGGYDFLCHLVAFYHFSKNCVLAGEPLRGRDGDEELRTIGVGAGVGHGQLARFVEAVGRALGFVLELVAGAAEAGTRGISALDHEVGNHAMEDSAVIEAVFALLAADRVGPLALAFGEFGEVGYGFGRFFFEEAADDGAFSSIDDGVSTGLTGHWVLSFSRCEGKMPSRQPARRRRYFGAVAGAAGFFAAGLAAVAACGLAAAAAPPLAMTM